MKTGDETLCGLDPTEPDSLEVELLLFEGVGDDLAEEISIPKLFFLARVGDGGSDLVLFFLSKFGEVGSDLIPLLSIGDLRPVEKLFLGKTGEEIPFGLGEAGETRPLALFLLIGIGEDDPVLLLSKDVSSE